MSDVLNVTNSGSYSLGQGNTSKSSILMFGYEPSVGWTGSFTVQRKVSGQPTAFPALVTNLATGAPLTGSLVAGTYRVGNTNSEIIVSGSGFVAASAGTASFYYGTIAE